MIVKGYILSVLYVAICLFLTLLMKHLGVSRIYTRKVLHILVGFEWFILYTFMGGVNIHFSLVCLIFTVFLIIEYKMNLLPMMSSDGENAPGTVYYALAMLFMSVVCNIVPEMSLPFGIGVLCTSVGDGLAGIIGYSIKKHNPVIWKNKTLYGTVTNFVVSFVATYIFCLVFNIDISVKIVFALAVLSAIIELLSGKGMDNITVTIGVSLVAYGSMYIDNVNDYIFPILLTPIIVAVSLGKKLLTIPAVITALFLDIAVTLAWGNLGFIVLAVFFLGSALIEKVISQMRSSHMPNNEPRTASAIAYLVTNERLCVYVFTASVAESFADTCASAIGALSKSTYSIIGMKKCEQGTSGGVSIIGTIASFLASLLISCIMTLSGAFSIFDALLVALSGFTGCIFDSLLGATLQVKYRCNSCGKITESKMCCGMTEKLTGIYGVDNNVVNLSASIFTSIIVITIHLFI